MDPQTGVVTRTIPCPMIKGGGDLAWDGSRFLVPGFDEKDRTKSCLFFLDARSGAVVRRMPLRYGAATLAFDRGALYAADYPVRDYYDKQHHQPFPWSRKIHRLALPGYDVSPAGKE